ncbi:MAG: efflux RND transporter periplasmic adaptor subunit [Tenuifilaceae bacterium]|jgi:RND family efflux transporter MFP subunit|nr:efflux RND transporter periplasmic adaptor subunit [Tenuifilaceae bacterium]
MKIFSIVAIIAIALASCQNNQGHELLGCGHDHSHDHTPAKAKTNTHVHTDECDHNHDEEHAHHHSHAAAADDHKEHDHGHDHEEYGVIHVSEVPFSQSVRVGGEILQSPGDEQIVVANHDGLVFFASKSMQEGVAVSQNQTLVTLTSGALVHDNLEAGFLEAKAQYEKAKVDYERAQKLVADTIISEGQYLDTKLAYETSQLTYNNIRRNYENGGQKVLAPFSGFVKRIHIAEGEFVQAGQPLFTIAQNSRLVVKAEMPQRAAASLGNIRTANFITPYNGQVFSTQELNGKLISWGKSTAQGSYYIPVIFEIDNRGDLISGTYIEVYLKSATETNSIAIPKTALLEEFGNYYVFVESHEGWEKRYVHIDGTDGKMVRIAQGLKVGDHVATANVSRIKLSQMSGQLPEHAHVH